MPDKFSIACMKRNEIHKIIKWPNLFRHLRGTRTMRVEINESDEDTDEGPSSQGSRHRRVQHHRSIKLQIVASVNYIFFHVFVRNVSTPHFGHVFHWFCKEFTLVLLKF